MLESVRQAILGKGNRATTILGVSAALAGVFKWLSTGEFDVDAFAFIAVGVAAMLARGGGTGSDTPA